MKREIIPYIDEKTWLAHRLKDLTSSDIPVLFNCGYTTIDELIHSKKNCVPLPFKSNERMDWGTALQDAIAAEFARQNKWTIRKKSEYIRIPELRIASSFDFEIEGVFQFEGKPTELVTKNELLEIKNVDLDQYKKKWLTRGFEIEATPYIELQVQHELLVSGLETAYIGVLVGGNQGICLPRKANKHIQMAILQKAAEFWRMIDEI